MLYTVYSILYTIYCILCHAMPRYAKAAPERSAGVRGASRGLSLSLYIYIYLFICIERKTTENMYI